MSCCGGKRDALKRSFAARTAAPAAVPPPPPDGVRIRYLGATPILVRGPVSGLGYRFTRSDPVSVVDARDLAPLLRTQLFQRDEPMR